MGKIVFGIVAYSLLARVATNMNQFSNKQTKGKKSVRAVPLTHVLFPSTALHLYLKGGLKTVTYKQRPCDRNSSTGSVPHSRET